MNHQLKITGDIADEWNRNLPHRARELETGRDLTFHNVTLPIIGTAVRRFSPGERVLDFGSGLGFVADHLAGLGFSVTGVDISRESVRYAATRFPRVRFLNCSIEEFSMSSGELFDACVGNLVLHNSVSLSSDLRAVAKLLKASGVFLGLMLNPEVWFARRREAAHKIVSRGAGNIYHVPFRLREGVEHPRWITYVHRSLNDYVMTFKEAGFRRIEFIQNDESSILPKDLMFFKCDFQGGEESLFDAS